MVGDVSTWFTVLAIAVLAVNAQNDFKPISEDSEVTKLETIGGQEIIEYLKNVKPDEGKYKL